MKLLKIAYRRAYPYIKEELYNFYTRNKSWLRKFALFMAIKEYHNNISWLFWDEKYRRINTEEVKNFEKKIQISIYFGFSSQYFFYRTMV